MNHTHAQYFYILCLNIVDHHNNMENTTTRLAVQIQHHPPFPFSWDDNLPQKSRSELKEEEVLPNEDDGHQLYQRMMNFMMEFEFKSLSNLRQILPDKHHASSRTQVGGNSDEAPLSRREAYR